MGHIGFIEVGIRDGLLAAPGISRAAANALARSDVSPVDGEILSGVL